MRRNSNNRSVQFARAPALFESPPRRTIVNQPRSRTTGADTTEEPTMLAQRDNFDRVANMAREAYNIGKEILGELNVEDKIFTIQIYKTSAIQPDFNNNVAPVLLNAVPQSVNEQGRTGDSIEMRGIRLTMRLIRNSSATFNNNYVRVFIVYYDCHRPATVNNFPTGAGTQDGIWDYELASTTMAPAAQKDYDSKAKFKIVWDKTFKLTQEEPEILFHEFIKLRGKHVQFENDTSAINTGQLEIMFVGDQAASSVVNAYWHTRLYFVDN